MHEVGHCLGLAHSAMNPDLARPPRNDGDTRRDYFPEGVTSLQPHPRMSYGTIRTVTLEPDDAVGASLLYPAPGFLDSRGSLTGRVVLASGEPAPFVYVTSVMYTADGALFGSGSVHRLLGAVPPRGSGARLPPLLDPPAAPAPRPLFHRRGGGRRHPRTPTRAALARDSCRRNDPGAGRHRPPRPRPTTGDESVKRFRAGLLLAVPRACRMR